MKSVESNYTTNSTCVYVATRIEMKYAISNDMLRYRSESDEPRVYSSIRKTRSLVCRVCRGNSGRKYSGQDTLRSARKPQRGAPANSRRKSTTYSEEALRRNQAGTYHGRSLSGAK